MNFPQISDQPVSLHPYKLFALNPLAYLLWKSVQIAGAQGIFGPKHARGVMIANAMVITANFTLNLGSLVLMKERYYHMNHYPRLKNAVIALGFLQWANSVDFGSPPNELDYRLGSDVVFVRAAILATTLFLSIMLVLYANKDTPFVSYSIELENLQSRHRILSNDDEAAHEGAFI